MLQSFLKSACKNVGEVHKSIEKLGTYIVQTFHQILDQFIVQTFHLILDQSLVIK